jgi:hypothetical protein
MLGERAALDYQRFCFWFGPVASAGEAMVTESVTDSNPQVDADESSRRRLDRTKMLSVTSLTSGKAFQGLAVSCANIWASAARGGLGL